MVLGIGKRSSADIMRQVGKVASVAGMGALSDLPDILLMAQAKRLIGKI